MSATNNAKLKDETEVLIRPMTRDDLEGSHAFFCGLPAEDRACLRRDVTQRDVIADRIHEMEVGSVRRLVAVADGAIVADGALELSRSGWERHVGEVRIIVAESHQRKGLGMLMANALYDLAASDDLEEIVAKMIDSQAAARSICQRLGFREDAVLRNFVKDGAGSKRDLVVMRCELSEVWQQPLTEG